MFFPTYVGGLLNWGLPMDINECTTGSGDRVSLHWDHVGEHGRGLLYLGL